jgi:hypothetical protein
VLGAIGVIAVLCPLFAGPVAGVVAWLLKR